MSFYDKVTLLVDERKFVDFVYFNLLKSCTLFPQDSPGEAGSLQFGQIFKGKYFLMRQML